MKSHEVYISRCIEIAKNGLGNTRPNPMVGAVIVSNNKIIGEGYTSAYGGSHAEVNAINSVGNKSLLKEATLYVTLEPCSHFGKTPPCSDLIIKHKIPNVVIGCIDDNIKVAGQGIKKLKNAGCKVIVGVLEHECKTHHKRFFTFHNKKRPYIILKWAETPDGFIAPKTKQEQKPVWITNSYSRQLVHKWRSEEQAILVGTNTVLEDNPSLTTRTWTGENPIRVVIDENEKGVDKYYSILKTSMKDKYGNENAKFELVQSVGLLYLKDGNAGEKAPDIGGPVTVDLGNGQTVSQKFGGWVNVNEEAGTKTLSCGLVDAIKKEESESYFSVEEEDDDMPF